MRFNVIIGLALATGAIAAPLAESVLNSTVWTPDHILQPDEVILYGEGRSEYLARCLLHSDSSNVPFFTVEVVHESVYHALMASHGVSLDAPELEDLNASLANRTRLNTRGDCHTTAVVTDRTQTFIDWDVQMSPVVIGTGNGIDVFVSSGYSVSNSVSVSAGLDWTLVKDKVGVTAGIDYTRTWTTQTVINIKGTVPNGYSGVMITRPIKTRKYGRVLSGCLGSQTQTGTFMADAYKEGSYAGVKWVSGAITMCTKKQFPLSRCNGGGNFI